MNTPTSPAFRNVHSMDPERFPSPIPPCAVCTTSALPALLLHYIHSEQLLRQDSLFLPPSREKSLLDFVFEAFFKYHCIQFPQESAGFHPGVSEILPFSLPRREVCTQLRKGSASGAGQLGSHPRSAANACVILPELHNLSVPRFCFFISKVEKLIVPNSYSCCEVTGVDMFTVIRIVSGPGVFICIFSWLLFYSNKY